MTPELPDRWTCCVLMSLRIASAEGRLEDSDYTKAIAYEWYEGGAFEEEGFAKSKNSC